MCYQRLLKKIVVHFVITYKPDEQKVLQRLFPFIDKDQIGK